MPTGGSRPGQVRVCVDEKTAVQARSRLRTDVSCAQGFVPGFEFEDFATRAVNLQGAYKHGTGQVLPD